MRSSLTRVCIAALAAAAAVAATAAGAAAQGFNANYLPIPRGRLRPFPLKRVELPPHLPSGRPFTVSGVTLREAAENSSASTDGGGEVSRQLVFAGRDRAGREWEVRTGGWTHYQAAYVGDLDRNGVRDLVVAIGTGANGLGDPTHLVFLTFDREGRPNLFEATGFFDPRRGDIFDLADLDGDGRAELIHMAFDDGYWVTNLYLVREAAWSRVGGRFAGLTFPAYTRFTNRPNRRPVRPAPGRSPRAPDLIEEDRRRQAPAPRETD